MTVKNQTCSRFFVLAFTRDEWDPSLWTLRPENSDVVFDAADFAPSDTAEAWVGHHVEGEISLDADATLLGATTQRKMLRDMGSTPDGSQVEVVGTYAGEGTDLYQSPVHVIDVGFPICVDDRPMMGTEPMRPGGWAAGTGLVHFCPHPSMPAMPPSPRPHPPSGGTRR